MQNTQNPQDEAEISLLEILIFLKGAWRLMGIMGLVGLGIAGVYLLLIPPQYEASTTISMLKVPAINNILGANVEEPAALIASMSLPSALTDEVINACGSVSGGNGASLLAKSIKLAIPKGVTSAVELKVTRPTSELATVCAGSVAQLMKQSQAKIISSLADNSLAANKTRLNTIAERLSQDKALLNRAVQPNGPLTPTYFAVLSEIRALEDEQARITVAMNMSGAQEADVQAPIETSDHPVYPKGIMSLAAGLMGGLFLGLLIALARQMVSKLKSQAGGLL